MWVALTLPNGLSGLREWELEGALVGLGIFALAIGVSVGVGALLSRFRTAPATVQQFSWLVIFAASASLAVLLGLRRFDAVQGSRLDPFAGSDAAYSQICHGSKGPDGDSTGMRKGAPRLLLVDSETGKPDDEHWRLPEALRAQNPQEARFLACLTRDREQVGFYTYSKGESHPPEEGKAYRYLWRVSLLDLATERNLGNVTLKGGDPPEKTTYSGDAYGSEPGGELRVWLQQRVEQALGGSAGD
jgi:hypothetical protein